MILKPEPLSRKAVENLRRRLPGGSDCRPCSRQRDCAFAAGPRFTQSIASELAAMDRVVLICGRYEGVDERVTDFIADHELSIGDYVLSGGELAAQR